MTERWGGQRVVTVDSVHLSNGREFQVIQQVIELALAELEDGVKDKAILNGSIKVEVFRDNSGWPPFYVARAECEVFE